MKKLLIFWVMTSIFSGNVVPMNGLVRQISDCGIFSNVPHEIILRILKYQLSPQELRNFGLTCFDLNKIAWDTSLWTKLNFTGHKGVVDTDLVSIAIHCPRLQGLKIPFYDQVADAGLASLAAGCGNLRSLDLFRCIKISDLGLIALAMHCPNLEQLDISFCCQITDEELAFLAADCRNLQKLNLIACNQISDQGLVALHGCQNLRALNVNLCNKITNIELLKLQAALPCLIITRDY